MRPSSLFAAALALVAALSPPAPAAPAPKKTGRFIVKLRHVPPPPRLLRIDTRIEATGGARVAGGKRVPYLLVAPKKPGTFRLPAPLKPLVEYVEPEIVMYAMEGSRQPLAVSRQFDLTANGYRLPARELRLPLLAQRPRIGEVVTGSREVVPEAAQAPSPSIPNDPHFRYQWGFSESGFGIRLPSARRYGKGAGVIVAVVDSGVRTDLSDLRGTSFLPSYNAITSAPGGTDDNGHGSHVAGTIAQTTDNGLGGAGIAPAARILPVKALNAAGQGSNFTIASGIRYAADKGAQIINLSIGGAPSQTLKDAVTYAHARGVLLVASAGNSGQAVLTYPAAYPECFSVGAIEPSGRRAGFSQYGGGLSVVAPGEDILQQTLVRGKVGYYYFSGTSMAAPMVSGVAALVKSLRPTLTLPELRALLAATATDLGPRGRDPEYGSGLVNAALACERAAGGVVTPPDPMPGGPLPPVNPGEPADPPADPAPADPIIGQTVALFNVERAKVGLPPLAIDGRLNAAALAHSQDMKARGVLTHTGSDGSNPGQRMSRAGYPWKTYGECVAVGYPTPEAVVRAWMNSPGHRAIILGSQFTEVGVGKDGSYWTAVFGRR